MKKIMIFFNLLIFKISLLSGVIIETSHFDEITQYANKNTLLILDIDDTLLLPVQTLGTDVWFLYRVKQNESNGMTREKAFEKAISEWEAIRHITNVQIVEEKTDQIIQDLQNNNIVIMGLTSQGLALATRTVHQLHSLNIDLSKTAPHKEDLFFMNNSHGVLYRQGILFTSGTKKGKALLSLLEQINFHPETIVFINDKRTHLKDVEEDVEKEGFTFVGLRYNIGDERIQNFNKDIANIQWKYSTFYHILSDKEAVQILKSQL